MVVLLLTTVSFAQPSRKSILSGMEIVRKTDHSLISIDFSLPVRYVRHYPIKKGDQVRIQLQLIRVSSSNIADVFQRESLPPKADNSAKVVDVVYEGSDAGGRYLSVYFEKPVTFKVEQGNDYRSLKILVYHAQTPAASDIQSEADLVMAEKNYSRAIRLYTKMAKDEDAAIREHAQQQLGLAREKNGQMAHAKAEYRRYLELYPNGAGAEEVRKRLNTILESGWTPETAGEKSRWRKDFHGSFSQFYYYRESNTNADDMFVTQSLLNSNFDINLRLRSDDMDIQTVFIGDNDADFLDRDDSRYRTRAAYIELEGKTTGHSARIGRQTYNSGGVLDRFDGAVLGYQALDKVRLNLVGGFTVPFTANEINTDRHFYGLNLDIGTLADRWDFNIFFINQENQGITDRQAIGGEVSYFYPKGSIFSLIDYDILYHELNNFLVVGNHNLSTGANLVYSVNYRQIPYLSSTNALIGQFDTRLDQMVDDLGEDRVLELAKDRTTSFSSVTLGITQPINQKLQVAADVSWFKLDGTEASGGIEAIEGSGDEYFYSIQLLGNSFIKNGDLATLGFRYGDTATADIYTINLDTRYPITEVWRVNPRLRVDFYQGHEGRPDQVKIKPSLHTDYRWNKKLQFEIEGGLDWSSTSTPDQEDDDSFGYYIYVGYRFLF
jgi:tetratricopeptide (TPR) repeat protein